MANLSLTSKIAQLATENPAGAQLLSVLSEAQTGVEILSAIEAYDNSAATSAPQTNPE
jgi:hypothetical protein